MKNKRFEEIKNFNRQMMLMELKYVPVNWLKYGAHAEQIIEEYMHLTDMYIQRNDIKDKYAADYIAPEYNLLMDAKNCFPVKPFAQLPTTIRFGNVLKVRSECIQKYYNQCKEKSDVFDWQWVLAIYNYVNDEIIFLTQSLYEELKHNNGIYEYKETSAITKYSENHIFFKAEDCLSAKEFLSYAKLRLNMFNDKNHILNLSTHDFFIHILKQYDLDIKSSSKLKHTYLLPNKNLIVVCNACFSKNSNAHLLPICLTEENCMLINSKDLTNWMNLQLQSGIKVAVAFYIKFHQVEKEVKFILLDDLLKFINLEINKFTYFRKIKKYQNGYNFSKEILISEKDFFMKLN